MKGKNFDTLLSTIENKLNNNYSNINNLFKSQNNFYTFDSNSNNYKQKEANTYFNYKNENDINILTSKSNYNPPYYSFSQISRNYNGGEIKNKNKLEESKKENSCSQIIYDEEKYIKEINNIKIRNKASYNYNNKENIKYNNYFNVKKVEEEKDDYFNLKLGKNKIKNQYNSKTNSFNYINNNLSNLYNNHNYFLSYYKNENIKDSSLNGSEILKTLEYKDYDKYEKNDNIHNINYNNINIGINNNNFIIESEVRKDYHKYSSPFLYKDINRNPNKNKNENSFNRNKFYNPKNFYNTEGNNNYNNTKKINNYIFTNYLSYKNKTKNKSFSSENNNKYDNNDFIDIKNYNSLNNSSKDKIIYIKKFGKRGKKKYSLEKNKLNLNEFSNNKNGNNNNEYISNIQGNNNIKENGINGNNLNSKRNFEIIKNRANDLLDVYTKLLYNKILNQANVC